MNKQFNERGQFAEYVPTRKFSYESARIFDCESERAQTKILARSLSCDFGGGFLEVGIVRGGEADERERAVRMFPNLRLNHKV